MKIPWELMGGRLGISGVWVGNSEGRDGVEGRFSFDLQSRV